jgi:hypothetical protein
MAFMHFLFPARLSVLKRIMSEVSVLLPELRPYQVQLQTPATHNPLPSCTWAVCKHACV